MKQRDALRLSSASAKPTELTCRVFTLDEHVLPPSGQALGDQIGIEFIYADEFSEAMSKIISECEDDLVVQMSPKLLRHVELRIVRRFIGKPNPMS